MKTFLLVCTVSLLALSLAALAQESFPAPTTPLPSEQAAYDFQRSADAWIKVLLALSVPAAALIGGIVMWVKGQVQNLRDLHQSNAVAAATAGAQANAAMMVAAKAATPQDIDTLHERVNSAVRIALDNKPMLSVPPLAPPVTTAIALVAALFLTGCSTTGGKVTFTSSQKQELADVFNVAVQGALTAGTAALSGEKGQAVPMALFTAAATGQPFQQLVTDAITSNGGTVPQAQQINGVVTTALSLVNGSSSAQKVAALNTVGAALQNLANQNAK